MDIKNEIINSLIEKKQSNNFDLKQKNDFIITKLIQNNVNNCKSGNILKTKPNIDSTNDTSKIKKFTSSNNLNKDPKTQTNNDSLKSFNSRKSILKYNKVNPMFMYYKYKTNDDSNSDKQVTFKNKIKMHYIPKANRSKIPKSTKIIKNKINNEEINNEKDNTEIVEDVNYKKNNKKNKCFCF